MIIFTRKRPKRLGTKSSPGSLLVYPFHQNILAANHSNGSTRTHDTCKGFALSKTYYMAQVLPLPEEQKKRVERNLSRFIFRERHERLQLSVLVNKYVAGGWGCPTSQ